jgi:hypothetical protein
MDNNDCRILAKFRQPVRHRSGPRFPALGEDNIFANMIFIQQSAPKLDLVRRQYQYYTIYVRTRIKTL